MAYTLQPLYKRRKRQFHALKPYLILFDGVPRFTETWYGKSKSDALKKAFTAHPLDVVISIQGV